MTKQITACLCGLVCCRWRPWRRSRLRTRSERTILPFPRISRTIAVSGLPASLEVSLFDSYTVPIPARSAALATKHIYPIGVKGAHIAAEGPPHIFPITQENFVHGIGARHLFDFQWGGGT